MSRDIRKILKEMIKDQLDLANAEGKVIRLEKIRQKLLKNKVKP